MDDDWGEPHFRKPPNSPPEMNSRSGFIDNLFPL